MDILTSTMESLTTTTDTLTSTMESLTTTDTLTTTIPYISLFLLLTTSLIQALLSVQTTQHEAKIAKLQAKSDAALTKVRLDSAESNRRANFELETKERVIEEGEAKDKKITNLKNFVAAQAQKLAAEKNRMAAKEQESYDLAMQVRHKADELAAFTSRVASLEAELSKANKHAEDIQTQLDAKNTALQNLDDLVKLLETTQDLLTDAHQNMASLWSQRNEKDAELAAWQGNTANIIHTLSETINTMKDTHALLQQENALLTTLGAANQARVVDLEDVVEMYRQENAEERERGRRLEEDVEFLEEERLRLLRLLRERDGDEGSEGGSESSDDGGPGPAPVMGQGMGRGMGQGQWQAWQAWQARSRRDSMFDSD
jgi:hypothetical protein